MTPHNYGRLAMTMIVAGVTAVDGWEVHYRHLPNAYRGVHVFFGICSLAMIARVIYSYVKGED